MGMSWCTCPFGYAKMRMSSCRYVMMQMLWCRCNSFKNSLYFQNEASSAPETKIFSRLDYYSRKAIFFFWLKALQKLVITIKKISKWGINLESDNLDLKIYFHNLVEQKGWHISKAFSGKWVLWKIKHLKKIHFFNSWIWQFDKRQDPPW